ncbi:MAG: HAD-IIIA family hydrolase [Crocinitomicaceae bacterium]|nr:HAD-IIIA family hydrolase [Crocinitomicaceae bacterium]MDG1777063.1 HAD-IIIA family hydrolase [Crocinitomicaceae bacterium]
MNLEENIKGLCDKNGIDFVGFLADMDVETVYELSVSDLEVICEEYELDLNALLFKFPFKSNHLKSKLDKIKLLVIDVDGVMTDGGMYFTESGDQFKKFNTKDGMAIIHLTKSNFQVAIISSGFKGDAVARRAEMLGIQHCSVSRSPKIETLSAICKELNINLENVAMIGDDINDLAVIEKVGFSACPKDAVNVIKSQVDVILENKGGEGCVRELIDMYILKEPLS